MNLTPSPPSLTKYPIFICLERVGGCKYFFSLNLAINICKYKNLEGQETRGQGNKSPGRTIPGYGLAFAWLLSSEIWNYQLHCDWK